MSYVKISRGVAVGDVILPASKSILHRAYICAAIASGSSVINGYSDCDDVNATLGCISSLGASVTRDSARTVICGGELNCTSPLYCGDSATTLRLLLPLMLCGRNVLFKCSKQLLARPMSVYRELCAGIGADYVNLSDGIKICGKLRNGEYKLRGDISSQFVSGLMLALPLLDGNSRIILTTELKSRSYVLITQKIMSIFGVNAEVGDRYIDIKGGQSYKSAVLTAEADESCAAYIGAFNYIGGNVNIKNRASLSVQGDSVWQMMFDELCKPDAVVDVTDTPDLAPALMALAAIKNGALIKGVGRLKYKESDRLQAMADGIKSYCDAEIRIDGDEVYIGRLKHINSNAVLDSCGDHRIAMALSLLCSVGGGTIKGAECVSKSFCGFFDILNGLGVNAETEG